jgi:hypothetical protein
VFGDVGPACTTVPGRRTASPLQLMETRLLHMILYATGRRCRGDPVGRPWGRSWAGTRDDAVPSSTIAPGRRTASPLQLMETRLLHMILYATGRRCRGDPVGRPWGTAGARRPRALCVPQGVPRSPGHGTAAREHHVETGMVQTIQHGGENPPARHAPHRQPTQGRHA